MLHMTVWTIYRSPNDYPGRWVMRGHDVFPTAGIVRAREACFVAGSLEEVRAKVPPSTHRVRRAPDDFPVIYECWLEDALSSRLN